MLQTLAPYGPSRPQLRSFAGATFGRSLYECVPEDAFDNQPLIGASRFLFAADARLDNRDELIRELGEEPSGFSDADILVRAWMRWGEGCLERLVGDFALALFDRERRTLILARDPTGQRPLYFVHSLDFVAFASMPSALFGIRRGGFRLDRLAATHTGTIDVSEATDFEEIGRVIPGHVATLATGKSDQRRYWNPPRTPLRLSDEDYVHAYRDELGRAVGSKLRRRSGDLGVHLSSGWDSSAVTATAARLGAEPIAFTAAPRVGFDGPVPRGRIADESALASVTAQMHGLQHHIIRPEGDLLGELRVHSRIYQEPGRNIVNMQWWSAVHRAARARGVSTLLTGQLGNLSVHSAGLWVLAEWLRRGEPVTWLKQARAAARQSNTRWRGILINSFGEWLPTGFEDRLQRLIGNAPPAPEASFIREEWRRPAELYSRACEQPRTHASVYAARLRWIEEQDVGPFRLGALAETGVDERDPMADRRLLDFSFSLPPDQLIWNGERRPLARRALADRLPRAVLDAERRGYQGADWYERVNAAEAHAIVEELRTSAAASDLLDLDKMQRAIGSWPSSGTADPRVRTIYRTRLLGALSTGVFLQEFEVLSGQAASGSRGDLERVMEE